MVKRQSDRSVYSVSEQDQQMIQGCVAGDRLAQKKLYDRYKDAMYTLCFRITNDPEAAQDALQESFIGIFRGIHLFRAESTLGAWIKSIVVRTTYRHVRRQIQHEPLEQVSREESADWGHELDAGYLAEAIQSLPTGYRMVFVLIEVEGYSHKEVATMLGVSTGTTKSQLFHAKRQLQFKLKALGVYP
ncbi:MAG: RNA polymerase sigma factor [Bacteroidetes bacterium]|nr:MAG: RNA polymerase sigma factor [Bacteroidota bacterium]